MATLALKGGPAARTRPFLPWPQHGPGDLERLTAVLESSHWASDGPMEREFERLFAKRHGASDCVGVTNGTVTLLLCLRALGIKPGDEVIVPALTWIATATSVLEGNGVPVFVDVDPETFCIDPKAVERAITPRTIAVIPVHLYWAMADMDALLRIASARNLSLIEDCAHAHGASYKGRGAGSIGHLGSFSFQSSKVMSAGEGGAIIGQSKELLDKVYSLKNCSRVRDDRGAPVMGGNHRLSEWQAAVLLGQLERFDEQMSRRNANAARLTELVAELPGIRPLAAQPDVDQRPMYRFAFHYDKRAAGGIPRDRFIDAVRAEGVPIEPPYPVVYKNNLYRTTAMDWYPGTPADGRCPVAEGIATDGAFMLPHQILLGNEDDLRDVVTAFRKVLENPSEAASMQSRAKDHVKGLLRKLR